LTFIRRKRRPPFRTGCFDASRYEIKNLGCFDCPARTEEQRVIGLFYTDPGPAQTGRAFRQVAQDFPMSLADNARLFAMLYVALADAAIASVETKYYYGFWATDHGHSVGGHGRQP
jgi:hypothetical protein